MTDQAGDSDLRRRAAWLLAALAVVAALVVVLFITLTHTSGSDRHTGAGPDDSLVAPPPTSTHRTTSTRPVPSSTSKSSASTTRLSCAKLCVVDGDPGNSIDAINDYRAKHGKSRVPGTVSKKAQRCAVSNGNDCSGGWAETQVSKPTGSAALAKIVPLGKLLDSQLKSFDVGWAYDPGARQYYFSIIKHG